jgi:hypothetical protein
MNAAASARATLLGGALMATVNLAGCQPSAPVDMRIDNKAQGPFRSSLWTRFRTEEAAVDGVFLSTVPELCGPVAEALDAFAQVQEEWSTPVDLEECTWTPSWGFDPCFDLSVLNADPCGWGDYLEDLAEATAALYRNATELVRIDLIPRGSPGGSYPASDFELWHIRYPGNPWQMLAESWDGLTCTVDWSGVGEQMEWQTLDQGTLTVDVEWPATLSAALSDGLLDSSDALTLELTAEKCVVPLEPWAYARIMNWLWEVFPGF